MKMLFLMLLIFTALLFSGCGSRKSQIEKLVNREVLLPSVICGNALIKMVVYFDSTMCASCELSRLWEWDEASSLSKETNDSFTTIFIFSPGDKGVVEVENVLKRTLLRDKCVYIDDKNEFIFNNPFLPKDALFHTFLLDKDNKIVLIGNPVKNKTLWELYKVAIGKLIAEGGTFSVNK